MALHANIHKIAQILTQYVYILSFSSSSAFRYSALVSFIETWNQDMTLNCDIQEFRLPHLAFAESNTATCQIVRTQLNGDTISDEDLHKVLSDLAANGRQHRLLCLGSTIDCAAEHGVRETFNNGTLNLDDIVLLFPDTLGLILSFISLGPSGLLPE